MGLMTTIETGFYTLLLLALWNCTDECFHVFRLLRKVQEERTSNDALEAVTLFWKLHVDHMATVAAAMEKESLRQKELLDASHEDSEYRETEDVLASEYPLRVQGVSSERMTPCRTASFSSNENNTNSSIRFKIGDHEDDSPPELQASRSMESSTSKSTPYSLNSYNSFDGSMDLIEDQLESDESLGNEQSEAEAGSSSAVQTQKVESRRMSSGTFEGAPTCRRLSTGSSKQLRSLCDSNKLQRQVSSESQVSATHSIAMAMKIKGRMRRQSLVCSSADVPKPQQVQKAVSMQPSRTGSMDSSIDSLSPSSRPAEQPKSIGVSSLRRQDSIRGTQRQNPIRSAVEKQKPIPPMTRGVRLPRAQSVSATQWARSQAQSKASGSDQMLRGSSDHARRGNSDHSRPSSSDHSSSRQGSDHSRRPRSSGASVAGAESVRGQVPDQPVALPPRRRQNRRMSVSDHKMIMRMRSSG